jgi:hypothetical protein
MTLLQVCKATSYLKFSYKDIYIDGRWQRRYNWSYSTEESSSIFSCDHLGFKTKKKCIDDLCKKFK